MRASLIVSCLLSLAACLPLAIGCDPTVFGDLEDQASTRVLEKPDSYPKLGFGSVVAGYSGTDAAGMPVSRIAASGGPDTPFLIYEGWNGSTVQLDAALSDGCKEVGDCAAGASEALVGIPFWRKGAAGEGKLCLLASASTDGALIVRCEIVGNAGNTVNEEYPVMAGIGFGESGAAIDTGNAVGVAIFGAPRAGSNTGALYRVPDGQAPVAISIPADALGVNGSLGKTVATFALSPTSVLVAAGATGTGRAVVLQLDSDGSGGVTTTVRACIENGTADYGRAVALGDTNNDGVPELFVGMANGAVEQFPGSTLPAAAAAPGACVPWPGSTMVTCSPTDGVVCGNEFGAALAVGDISGDGVPDLVVGDPSAAVDGFSNAGALVAFAGVATPTPMPQALMFLSSPEADDRLGASVALMPSNLSGTPRMEPIGGAPGRNTVNVFLCSGLAGDTTAVGARCVVGQ